MRRFWRIMGFLAAASVGSLTVAAQGPETGPTVTIRTFQFEPNQIEVRTGTGITWINQDDIRHTITSGTPENRDGRFDAPLAGKGTKFSFTFMQPGTYSYFCDRHQHMRGEIRVQ